MLLINYVPVNHDYPTSTLLWISLILTSTKSLLTMITRGIRNNNPFNLRRSDSSWIGKVPHSESTDPIFEQFTDIKYGLRAGYITLCNYYRLYRLNSVASIINRFAPSSENNTKAYISYCESFLKRLSLPPILDEYCGYAPYWFMMLGKSMLRFESEFYISDEEIIGIFSEFNLYQYVFKA